MKKIDIVTKNFYPVLGGMEVDIFEIHNKFAEDGVEIIVHTSKDTFTEKNSLSDLEYLNKIKIQRTKLGLFGFIPQINWRETDIVVLNNFNIFPHFYILIKTLLLKIIGKKKYILVLTPYTGFTPIWSAFSKIEKFLKKTYHQTLGLFLVNNAVDGVRAISEWEKKILDKAGVKTKIRIIKCGLEKVAFSDPSTLASQQIKKLAENSKNYVVQVGRIHPLKNYETSIIAISKLKEVKLIIIGPNQKPEYKEKLDVLINELNLKDRVIFTGIIDESDKYYLIKKAIATVHTSLYEGFGIVVYEAMSQGSICIVTNNTAVEELIKEGVNGYVIKQHDSDGVAEKINYVINNNGSEELEIMKKNNLEETRSASWDTIAKETKSFYDSLR